MEKYTDQDINFMIEHAGKGVKWVAEQLGKPYLSVRAAYKNRKLKTGFDSQFKKGHETWNKGKKGLTSANKSSFKKGNMPHNTKADGVITVRTDKEGREYKWIRVALGKWEMLHVHNWVKAHGPVPKGFIVVFQTKDRMNCEVSNLKLVSRADHIINNQNREKAALSLRETKIKKRRKLACKKPDKAAEILAYNQQKMAELEALKQKRKEKLRLIEQHKKKKAAAEKEREKVKVITGKSLVERIRENPEWWEEKIRNGKKLR